MEVALKINHEDIHVLSKRLCITMYQRRARFFFFSCLDMCLLQSLRKDSWKKCAAQYMVRAIWYQFNMLLWYFNFCGFLLFIIHAGANNIKQWETIEIKGSLKIFVFLTGVEVLSSLIKSWTRREGHFWFYNFIKLMNW